MRYAYRTRKLNTLSSNMLTSTFLHLFALRQSKKEQASHNWSSSTYIGSHHWISFDGSIHRSSLRLPWNSKASLRWFAPQFGAAVVKSPRASESPIPAHKGEQLGIVNSVNEIMVPTCDATKQHHPRRGKWIWSRGILNSSCVNSSFFDWQNWTDRQLLFSVLLWCLLIIASKCVQYVVNNWPS